MKKIMFNNKYGLTAAVIELLKTNTRRPCKDKATKELILANDVHSWRYYSEENIVEFVMNDGSVKVAVPPYKVGEVAAVAQPYSSFRPLISHNDDYSPSHPGWNNKLFVRADLMPHQVLFTSMDIEPLQNISDDNCLKEGIMIDNGRKVVDDNIYVFDVYGKHIKRWYFPTPKEAFAALINKVSSKGTWESNPYVFAYTFKLVI